MGSEGIPLVEEVDLVECSEEISCPGSDSVDLPFLVTMGDYVGLKCNCAQIGTVFFLPVEVFEALFREVRNHPVVVEEVVAEFRLDLW